MRYRILLTLILLVGFCYPPQAATAAEVSNAASFIYTDAASRSLIPYEPAEITIGLLGYSGHPLAEPPKGKIYFWATDSQGSQPLEAMDIVPLSIKEGLYIHGNTGVPGVFIADARAFQQQQSFKVRFSRAGTYLLKGVYIPEGMAFDPDQLESYDRLSFAATGPKARTLTVGTATVGDVAFMRVSPAIKGVELPGLTVQPPRGHQEKEVHIPISADGQTPTTLSLTLYRSNGEGIGAGVPVYVTTSAPGVQVSPTNSFTDTHGVATVQVTGLTKGQGHIGIRLNPNDDPVLIPVAAYSYHPQTVRLGIGNMMMDVDGRSVYLDAPPVVKDGRTYVPYRAIGEILGAEISYNQTIQTITTNFNDKIITMTLGYDHYAVNNQVIQMDARPFISENNRTMVPIRFMADATGYKVRPIYDNRGRTSAIIFTKN
ncbi:stalk domain-containing protein [Peptococcus simiae]|uniref:Stalk domain-containing protein n=1 Tax=Peptococcus simiae TaxID=1643805 RepID=A0ABW9GZP1_9FIRM